METKRIFSELLKDGAKEVKGCVVKNATISPMDNYVRIGLTLDKEVDGYRSDEDGNYQEAKVNVIFVSAFTIASILKDDDNAAFAANHLVKHPDALGMILSRAKIDVVQQKVASGEEYINPFSSDPEPITFTHNTIINYISKIELGEFGLKRLDRLADMMLEF